MSDKHPHYEVEDYADHEVQELVGVPIPTFLKWVYVILPIWGLMWMFYFWNGSTGPFDRGSWNQLQTAARTTFVKSVPAGDTVAGQHE